MNFLYPSFLFALGAVSIPVIIHLFDLQRPKKVYFTNVQLLRNVNEQTRTTRNLRHLLVLFCRMLFITFLVLAFAQPFIKGDDANASTGSQAVAVYIDNSLSMQNEEGNVSLLDKAVGTLEKIPQLFHPASQYFFLDNNFNAKDRLPLAAEKFRDRVTETGYSNIYRDLQQVYKRQANSFADYGRPGEKKIFWFSDFQKSTSGNLSKIEPDSAIRFYLVPLQNTKTSNVFVDSVWLENLFVRQNETNTLKVKLSNSGEREVKNLHLKLIIDDIQSGTASLEMAPNGSATALFDFSVKDTVLKKCKITFEDNPSTFDNQYFFIMQVSPGVNILQISDGKQGFIRSLYSNENIFRFTENKYGNISAGEIEKANLIIADGFDKLNSSEIGLLKTYREKGGSLLLFPTEKPDATILADISAQLKLPAIEPVFEDIEKNDPSHTLQFPDIKNPFFENVFEKTDKNIDMPYAIPVIKVVKGQKILQNKQELAFLSVVNPGKSPVYICTSPLKEPFTNFQKHSVFVPVMYKIAINSVAENRTLAYTFNDKNVVVPVSKSMADKKFSIRKEDFNYLPDQSLHGNKLIFDMPSVPMDAGFYELALNDSVQRILAINPGKQESTMDFYTPDELKTIFSRFRNVSVFENEINDNFISEYKAKHLGLSLWKYCLLIALGFLLAETLLIRFWK